MEPGRFRSKGSKVMDYLGIEEIPAKHIMKRWTKDARDILPDHLKQYQRDQMNHTLLTYRHNRLYLKALELVRLGDASVEAYSTLNGLFDNNLEVMKPFDESRDGLGLEDRAEKTKENFELSGCNRIEDVADDRVSVTTNPLVGLKAPTKKRGGGRPTNARDKAPYEGLSKRSRFCSICRAPGHKKTTCTERGEEPAQARKEARCSKCSIPGHKKSTCERRLG